MSERIEEIRKRYGRMPELAAKQAEEVLLHETFNGLPMTSGAVAQKLAVLGQAVSDLLERIDELERETGRLRQECIFWKEMAHSPIPDE